MILITYQDPDGTVRILSEFNDEEYETAWQKAEDYFTNVKQLIWMELLLTEADAQLDGAVCLHAWRPLMAATRPKHPKTASTISPGRKTALVLSGLMILIMLFAGTSLYIGSITQAKVHTYQEGGLGYK